MKIAVGTQNPAKNAAVKTVFAEAFPNEQIELISFDVESGVAAMPFDNDETASGAINRADAVRDAAPSADYWVGLEGGVFEGPLKKLYLLGWAAVFAKEMEGLGLGHSAGIALPDDISIKLKNGEELGPLIQKRMADDTNDIRRTIGTNGLLTRGLYPRDREFEDALRVALAPFVSPEFYDASVE